MNKIERAKRFAAWAHEGHKRKYTGEPYIIHPLAVAKIVATVPHTTDMIVAACCHDTVEDCDVSLDEIRELFGSNVAELVEMLTDTATILDGNRAARCRVTTFIPKRLQPARKLLNWRIVFITAQILLVKTQNLP